MPLFGEKERGVFMHLTHDIYKRLHFAIPDGNQPMDYQGDFVQRMLKNYLCQIMIETYNQESWKVYDKNLRDLLIWFDSLIDDKTQNNDSITHYLLSVLSSNQGWYIEWRKELANYEDLSGFPVFVCRADGKIDCLYTHVNTNSLQTLLYVYDEFVKTFRLNDGVKRELMKVSSFH